MTAIAGFCDTGHVWMGGDSAGVSGWDLTVRADQKVFKNGDFLFGFTSSFRMGQLLQYKLQPPKQHDQETYAYMVTAFVDSVRECLKAGGFAEKDKERESGGVFLVGYKGRLFYVASDYQIAEALDGYDACGCGDAFIRGALFATKGMDPQRRMEISLQAAERHSAGVRGPFQIMSI